MRLNSICILGLVVLLTGSCLNDDDGNLFNSNQPEIDKEIIEEYLAANNLMATEDPSGIYYIIEEPGSGGHPKTTSDVEVSYRGYFLDGTDFDGTKPGETITFNLQGVILGWQIGIPLLQKGGKGTFFLPSGLAYGTRGSGPIAPNTVIAFDVELFDFQ